ncbi:hypothetical protein IWW36_003619 [Coemansia brasiliensis]|uniref:Maltase n=1 Tax=Coemansia brasiliensis TaxID=2650707 RepID=A0A9W8I9U6_9FUNG|nr:hypothetical protein IWW36_003619 [Coemansia brasiliensis]
MASSASVSCPGYKARHVTEIGNGIQTSLMLNGPPCNIYGQDISELILDVSFDTNNRLHVHISDTANTQYQIPPSVISLNKGQKIDKQKGNFEFIHSHNRTTGFGFKVVRDSEVIFDTIGHVLVFEDQYLELTSSVPTDANIYGLGETPGWFRRNPYNTTITLWNRDTPALFEENGYGSHAVYMELRNNSKFHGCYLHNSHGMDVVLSDGSLQYRVLGGTLDLYFFAGPTALDVIDQYTQLVGRPNRIPFWALGFHNCRFGYTSVYEVNQVIANYSAARIPLEAAWTDIEYMEKYRDFTFDPQNFPLEEMQKQLDFLHEHGQKMVLIIDPAIHVNNEYGPYTRGQEQDVFMRNADGSEFIGQVWPGYTAFPDWFAANVSQWWNEELRRYFDKLQIDGMWIDMNEAASFCTGSCGSGEPIGKIPPLPWEKSPEPHRSLNTSNTFLVPPYAIHSRYIELSKMTLETTAVHANGIIDYHVHNLYGYMESKLTYEFLRNYRPNIRPFVLSRSTFAGSGAFISHWTGDNAATWQDMHLSIASMFEFGIFGIPMVGADICGFYQNATEELCARWIELGAFYPFSRSHNSLFAYPQEPYRWKSVAEAARRALGIRYTLLPYIYSCYQDAVERGWPVVRPLVFEYPSIDKVADNDRQLLVGNSILVSPVLSAGARTVEAFFPAGLWYSWYGSHVVIEASNNVVTLNAPLEHINVHIRGGQIVPTQHPEMTTEEVRQNDYELIVAVDANGAAAGQLYIDDGQTLDTPHRWIDFTFYERTLWIRQRSGQLAIRRPLSALVLLGVSGIHKVQVNGEYVQCAINSIGNHTEITGLNISLQTNSRLTLESIH